MKKEYYIQGDPARAEEIKAAFEEKGCTLYRLASNCDSEDLIYYSLNGIVRGIKKDNLYLFDAHPGYKKLELPIQPNFKVGDWITDGTCKVKITDINNNYYWFSKNCILGKIESIDKKCRLWTIQDAKDGDVLETEDYIFIFKYILHGGVHLYCHYNIDDEEFDSDIPDAIIGNIHDKGAHFQPATKEQRDQFFKKMKEAGYTWDEEKKELKKKHYDIANFKPKQWVLVRNSDNQVWGLSMFSHRDMGFYICLNREDFRQCIPFEGNEKLLGTNDPCGKEFINW